MKLLITIIVATLMSCVDSESMQTGTVKINYLFLNDSKHAFECSEVGVTKLLFLAGEDLDNDGVLEDSEVQEFVEDECNLFNSNEDGFIEASELGSLEGTLSATLFRMFAIELFDKEGRNVFWRNNPEALPKDRISFSHPFLIFGNTTNQLNLDGLFFRVELDVFIN